MARFDDWSQEDLAWKCRELSDEIEELKRELSECRAERNSLEFKIDTELEPRLKVERASYDAWVTNPERGLGYEN